MLGLQAIAARLFGANVEVTVAPAVTWGGEDELSGDLLPPGSLAAVAVVFGLTATPEPENHGAFLRALAARAAPGTPLVALVDESAFRRRFAQEPARLAERREGWRELLAGHGFAPVFVDLEALDLAAAEADVEVAIGGRRDARG